MVVRRDPRNHPGAGLAKNPTTIFITEGELDSCALVEAGFGADKVLSVPNGATEHRNDTGEISDYEIDHLEGELIA
jgi:hypothetical protein